jgi:hypothetical protein
MFAYPSDGTPSVFARGVTSFPVSFGPAIPPNTRGDAFTRETEYELEQKAERYSELHGDDDDAERRPGIVARILGRLRGSGRS